MPGAQLPKDFAKTTPDSPKAHVLASNPGTQQACEAVIANQIPQTATLRRADASWMLAITAIRNSGRFAAHGSNRDAHVGETYFGI